MPCRHRTELGLSRFNNIDRKQAMSLLFAVIVVGGHYFMARRNTGEEGVSHHLIAGLSAVNRSCKHGKYLKEFRDFRIFQDAFMGVVTS